MPDPATPCPSDDVLVALAIGELTGRPRANALAHLLTCSSCRKEVDDLVGAVDQLLLAAPDAEPPLGFESRVVDQITAPPERAPRRLPWLAVAAAVVLLLAAIAGGLVLRGGGSSEIAQTPMVTPDGRDVGEAWRYHSDESWVFVSIPEWEQWGSSQRDFRLQGELDDGSDVELGAISFQGEGGGWGTTTSADQSRIRSVAVVDGSGHVLCRGLF